MADILDRLVALGAAHGRPADAVWAEGVRYAGAPDLEVELGWPGDDVDVVTLHTHVTFEVPRSDTLAVTEALLSGRGLYRTPHRPRRGPLRGVGEVLRRMVGTAVVVEVPGATYAAHIPFWTWDAARAVGTATGPARDTLTAWVEALPVHDTGS